MTAPKPPVPRPCSTWDPDPELGADWRGRKACRTCQRLGGPDDPAHRPRPQPVPKSRISPALIAAAQARDAAILGERDDPEEFR
ncbi:hypothetical protein AB0C02_30525 [Micromonospora sp. NPDC048999]|uniref:hypothetical protein n=1 Tax=Micromonospora sp. NPDC048999 TaxID=3155391 RepID=UPI0033E0ECDA